MLTIDTSLSSDSTFPFLQYNLYCVQMTGVLDTINCKRCLQHCQQLRQICADAVKGPFQEPKTDRRDTEAGNKARV
jgi:hypothetical protein